MPENDQTVILALKSWADAEVTRTENTEEENK